jgi:hypothetical protein
VLARAHSPMMCDVDAVAGAWCLPALTQDVDAVAGAWCLPALTQDVDAEVGA